MQYWDQYAADFASNYNEEMTKFIRDLALSLKTSSILEVGCSAGNDLRLFPQNMDVNGVDQSEFAICIAQKNLPFFKFKVGSITKLPYNDSSMDLVFTRNALNYVDDSNLEKAVQELFRVSKKYILNIESFSDIEQQISNETITAYGRNMFKLWSNFKVKIISNVEMHEGIDPKKSKFVLIRKI